MTDSVDLTILSQTLEHAPVGVWLEDSQGDIAWANAAMATLCGDSSNHLLGKSASATQTEFFQQEEDLLEVRDTGRWLRPLRQTLGEHTAVYFEDITETVQLIREKRHLSQKLQACSTTDELTGMLNRRALYQALEPQVSRSRRYGNPLALAVLEVKDYQAEDNKVAVTEEQALTGIAYMLRDQMRWVDLIGRTGDKQFTLVLPETSKEDALRLADKLTSRLNEVRLPANPTLSLNIQVAMGITDWQKGDDANGLLRRASQALDSAQQQSEGSVQAI